MMAALVVDLAEPSAAAIHIPVAEAFALDARGAELVRTALVLSADHELNASSFAARVVASTYAWVEVKLQNHSAKGITDKEFELARKIEDFVSWRPGKEGGALEGTPAGVRDSPISSTMTSHSSARVDRRLAWASVPASGRVAKGLNPRRDCFALFVAHRRAGGGHSYFDHHMRGPRGEREFDRREQLPGRCRG